MEKPSARDRYRWNLDQRKLKQLNQKGLDALVENHLLHTTEIIQLCAENKETGLSLELIQIGYKVKGLSDEVDRRLALLDKEHYQPLPALCCIVEWL